MSLGRPTAPAVSAKVSPSACQSAVYIAQHHEGDHLRLPKNRYVHPAGQEMGGNTYAGANLCNLIPRGAIEYCWSELQF